MIYEHTVPGWLLGVVLAVAVLAGAFSLFRFLPQRRIHFALGGFYLVTLGLMGWCLLLPGKKDETTQLLKPRFVVAIDTTKSMTLKPADVPTGRWEEAQRALTLPWIQTVAADCIVEYVSLGQEVSDSLDLDEVRALQPDHSASLVRDGLKRIAERYKGIDVAGVLLLSDGLDTREAFDDWADEERPFPVYSVRLEPDVDWEREPDVRIESVATPRRVSVGWQSELTAILAGQGKAGQAISVQLSEDGTVLSEKPTQVPEEGGEREVRFDVTHNEVGLFHYRVFVPPLPGETNTNDNETVVSVQVVDAKNRLLYVEGSPRWDYKYLRRTLLSDRQTSPSIFYTGPDGKPRAGISGGVDSADMSADQLTQFKVVILGNLSQEELEDSRASNLVDFVEEGGSLVLMGGSRAWGAGGLPTGGLGKVLPFKGSPGAVVQGEKPFPVRLTDTGRGHQAFAGDASFWEIVPPVLTVFPVDELSPAAQVLVAADTPDGPRPVVVVQRFGQGKVVTFLTDSMWRWQLSPEAAANKPYPRFWTQLIGWLLPKEDELDQEGVDLFADRDQVHLGDEVALTARVNGPPPEGGRVQCRLTFSDGRSVAYAMAAEQVVAANGTSYPGFVYRHPADRAGLVKAAAEIERDGGTVRSDPISFYVKPYSPETRPGPMGINVLQRLAASSGGTYYDTMDDLDAGLSELNPDAVEEETAVFNSMWRTWLVLVVLMALCTASWATRKMKNLP